MGGSRPCPAARCASSSTPGSTRSPASATTSRKWSRPDRGLARSPRPSRTRLLSEVDEKRNARTNATVEQLLARHLDVLEVEDTTRAGYERVIRLYIGPVLGSLPIGRLDGEIIDAFYAQLRTCRGRCGGRVSSNTAPTTTTHVTSACGPHQCRPLGEAYLRQIHNVLSGALTRAVKWRWIGVNPMTQAAGAQPTDAGSAPAHRRTGGANR